jgi:hypothetical protein
MLCLSVVGNDDGTRDGGDDGTLELVGRVDPNTVGTNDFVGVRETLGAADGACVGSRKMTHVSGSVEGRFDGLMEGTVDGNSLGGNEVVGFILAVRVGSKDGLPLGCEDGMLLGLRDGKGLDDGTPVGNVDGISDGKSLGESDGTILGY